MQTKASILQGMERAAERVKTVDAAANKIGREIANEEDETGDDIEDAAERA